MRVLVVDDQRSARRVLRDLVQFDEEIVASEAETLEEARALLSDGQFDLAFVDLRLTDDARNRDGLVLLRELRDRSATRVVVVSALGEMTEIRAAMRAGAWDYLLKDDLCEEIVRPILEDVRGRSSLEREILQLRAQQAPAARALDGLIGLSPAIQRLRSMIARVALSDRPVLVTGPSGSGKELVVRAIHGLGPRPTAPLVDLNCGALPEALVESQLFGHERGAFTGADRRVSGFLAAAKDGTLFLDEIAELPLVLQAKLLRVLETRRFRAVGALVDQPFVGRIVAATHADLVARVRDGRFREDLFHRLDVLRIDVPGLSERREDIPLLTAHFVSGQGRPLRFDEGAMRYLAAAEWSGNVRQLRNLVDRLAVFAESDEVSEASLRALDTRGHAPDILREAARLVLRSAPEDKLAAMELALVDEALALSAGNNSAAARLLGVHRKVIERRRRGETG